ncbi:Uncharacterised protein [Mycobacteroides abscessus subsp. abscessus]|nr:Uncharacterised protein [Mycobacteroides abscessus subsp. abscessus]
MAGIASASSRTSGMENHMPSTHSGRNWWYFARQAARSVFWMPTVGTWAAT